MVFAILLAVASPETQLDSKKTSAELLEAANRARIEAERLCKIYLTQTEQAQKDWQNIRSSKAFAGMTQGQQAELTQLMEEQLAHEAMDNCEEWEYSGAIKGEMMQDNTMYSDKTGKR